jgi:hypothetical protein
MAAILELLKLAIVGLIAGLFSSILANRDYRRRKWWELRVAAYQNAIEALSDLVHYYKNAFEAEITYLAPQKDAIEERIGKYCDQALPKIRKLADSGAFLFSAEANAALREFMTDERLESYAEHLDNNHDKAKKCLRRLIECSIVDLKLKPGLLERFF